MILNKFFKTLSFSEIIIFIFKINFNFNDI